MAEILAFATCVAAQIDSDERSAWQHFRASVEAFRGAPGSATKAAALEACHRWRDLFLADDRRGRAV